MFTNDQFRINLSLISHTNVGKTTLTRTLLMDDVGSVDDRAHVTEKSEPYILARDNQGCELIIWDTPGFGDSVRLAKRLEQRENPLGWFLSEVWDRYANRAFWLNQKAIRHVRDITDVVLYLIDARADAEEAAYLDAELRVLSWMEKPVIVLLNQMGEPLPEEEARQVERWKGYFSAHPVVRDVLPMDAFARCWVQETALFEVIGRVLPKELAAPFESLRENWTRGRRAIYARSLDAMGQHLGRLLHASETAKAPGLRERVKQLGSQLGLLKEETAGIEDAQTALSTKAADDLITLTDRLIKTNGLKGRASSKTILKRMKTDWRTSSGQDLGKTTAIGATVGAATTGLAVDVMTGGLSLGLGTIIGGIIGAIGGAGMAQVYYAKQNPEGIEISWSDEAMNGFLLETVLLYLAVAHFGRGRGEWVRAESPEHWKTLVLEEIKERPVDWNELREGDPDGVVGRLVQTCDVIMRAVFRKLYGLQP